MHAHNRLDGADEVLALYCATERTAEQEDRSFPGLIPGHLQHHPDESLCETDGAAARTALVWSEAARERSRSRGQRCLVLGSAWLYLLSVSTTSLAVPVWQTREERIGDLRDQRERERIGQSEPAGTTLVPEASGHSTLYFPDHGVGGKFLAARLAATLEAPQRTTVVLSETDFAQEELRQEYAQRAATVTRLGPRVRPLGQTGPNRLENLRDLVVGAEGVESNVAHWALLFSAAAGTPVQIHANTDEPPDGHGPVMETLRDLIDDPDAVHEFAAHEMGAQSLLPPQELSALLAWRTR